MLANPLCYEIMTPSLVGVAKTHLVLGKHSGRAALAPSTGAARLHPHRDELQHVYYRFVALADRKKNIYDQDLVGILPDPIRERRHVPVHEEAELIHSHHLAVANGMFRSMSRSPAQ